MSETVPDFTISALGAPSVPSPLGFSHEFGDLVANYTSDEERVLFTITGFPDDLAKPVPASGMLEAAGPRERLFFDPAGVHAGIITCGGLCPGLNDVIRAIVLCLVERYGVPRVTGIRFGYRGLLPEFGISSMDLTADAVKGIHRDGGTLLGSSRGHGERTLELVDALARRGFDMLFVIGGDGTQRGARRISEEAFRRGMKLAVIGVPKTIDNDLNLVDRTFGFDTAVTLAAQVVAGAHVEAHDAVNGIGIVKLMGRESGFIAVCAALAVNEADYVLIPEVPFELGGDNGLFAHLSRTLDRQRHAMIVLAEGAGQALLPAKEETDASGNRKFSDIGLFLRNALLTHFARQGREINVKYIDPGYIIRSAPADPHDSLYCAFLGRHAVHAAMAGKTGLVTSLVNNRYVHVPMRMVTAAQKRVDPDGPLWRNVLETTGQPPLMTNPPDSSRLYARPGAC